MDLIYKSGENTLKDVDETKGIIKGIGSYFGNEDSDGDVMVKGCYAKSINENFKRMRYLYQHRMDKVIGKFLEMVESDYSLDFVAKIAIKTQLGKDVFELIKEGVIAENSVGFMMMKNKAGSDGLNYITEAKLYEISAVTIAANPLAVMEGYKQEDNAAELMKQYLTERFDSLEKLVKSNISDDLGHAVEFEMSALKDLALSFSTTKSEIEEEPTEQVEKKEETTVDENEQPVEQEEISKDESHSEEEVVKEEVKEEPVVKELSDEEKAELNTKGIFAYLRDNL